MLRAKYRVSIKKEKEESWRRLIDKDKPWGKPYKIFIKSTDRDNTGTPTTIRKPDGQMTSSATDTNTALLYAKFPRAPAQLESTNSIRSTSTKSTEFDITETQVADKIRKLKNRSAPGLDGINHKALKVINKVHPSLITRILNGCIQWACFPDEWKIGKLVLAYKIKGDKLEADSYRPLTMLPTLGKLLERVLVIHLSAAFEGRISENQYGFRKGRIFEDCILAASRWMSRMRSAGAVTAVVSLDIKGAFDHILWSWILGELRDCRCRTTLSK